LHQHLQNLKLQRGQFIHLILLLDLMLATNQRNIADRQAWFTRLPGACTAQDGAHADQQFSQPEGLGDVVIRT